MLGLFFLHCISEKKLMVFLYLITQLKKYISHLLLFFKSVSESLLHTEVLKKKFVWILNKLYCNEDKIYYIKQKLIWIDLISGSNFWRTWKLGRGDVQFFLFKGKIKKKLIKRSKIWCSGAFGLVFIYLEPNLQTSTCDRFP